jgi:hypothetical protein
MTPLMAGGSGLAVKTEPIQLINFNFHRRGKGDVGTQGTLLKIKLSIFVSALRANPSTRRI